MTTFFTVHKQELDFDQDIMSQLDSLAQQIQEIEGEYYILPKEEYKDTFMWVLETNSIPYQLMQTSSQG